MKTRTARSSDRVILHLDMDAFYAAIEIRENPALRGKPVIVGHRGRRGVVSTCSYEARRFGVRSALPSVTAERLCPDAIWIRVRMGLYTRVSRRIRGILEDATPLIEPVSIDEAFLDMTGIDADLEAGRRTAAGLKKRIFEQERLTASVGVAPNKFLAKFASDMDKPDGLVVFRAEEIPSRLWPMPVDRIWGVGPKTAAALARLGLRTIGGVARQDRGRLVRALGEAHADHILRLARGEDDRPVEVSREPKSISEERTYGEDLHDRGEIHRELLARAEGVARSLRDGGLRACTVHLKVRTREFRTWTRSRTLDHPTDSTEVILAAAEEMFRSRIRLGGHGVRLLGVGASHFESGAPEGQLGLFSEGGPDRRDRVARVEDAVRRRFGEKSVTRAGLIRRPDRSSQGDEG